MKLSKIKIKNFRLLIESELEVHEETTLIVGRNNTAKTSLLSCLRFILKEDYNFSFNDYPLAKKEKLFAQFDSFIKNEISFDELCQKAEPILIEFTVDYSLDGSEDDLGALSPFIIDIDKGITTALIRVELKLRQDENIIRKLLDECYQEARIGPFDDAHKAINLIFSKLFELKVYAVNPRKTSEQQNKQLRELRNLFPIYNIPAERILGEDGEENNSLSSLITDFFNSSEEGLGEGFEEKINDLRETIKEANRNLQEKSDSILSELINKTIGFGYPNSEELQLGVTTQLSIDNQIKEQTRLSYKSGTDNGSLPESYNGLGYKNLIKIEFLLAAFAKDIKKHGSACIPLLFIEEPESHMHPQMQHTFANYLEEFLKKITAVHVQTFLTSHSSQIANTMDFSKIRYAQKRNNGVIFRNLSLFAQENEENIDFIKKYLTLTKCDLFFADKAILVEGASERLLLPDMIEKCEQAGDFKSQKYGLLSQYYTVIEIGGAYAYKFVPFIEFLDIPCLILTDLDPVANEDGKSKSVPVNKGDTTSNETIKWWMRKKFSTEDKTKIPLEKIMSMSFDDKTMNNCHIEFQTTENGLCGHSLEESIRNVNRKIFKLADCATEEELEFRGKSKTDFALNLIYEHENYNIPAYIKLGLQWLNDKKVYE